MLGISFETLNKKQIYYDVATIFPDLFHGNNGNPSFLNKQGNMLHFKTPKLTEYIEKTGSMIESDNNRRRHSNNLGDWGATNNDNERNEENEGEERDENGVIDDSASVPASYRY